jgi:hypothetical protein
MRPALIALIACSLPLGAYAHRGATPPIGAIPASKAKAESLMAVVTAENTAVERSGAVAATTPDVPSKEPPLCASPALSTWNPAATGDGRICTPTQWADAQRSKRG